MSERGILDQSGKRSLSARSLKSPLMSMLSSSAFRRRFASSHFSRVISTPPVLRTLKRTLSAAGREVVLRHAHPASDPPIQGIIAGANAGALPDPRASSGGEGLLRMLIWGANERREAYRSYGGGAGLSGFTRCRCGCEKGPSAPSSSRCSRGMNPGNMAVPPTQSMADAIAFRRSTGTCVVKVNFKRIPKRRTN